MVGHNVNYALFHRFRLSQKGGFGLVNEVWIKRVFTSVDAKDTETFLSFLDDKGEFRFGNMPAAVGKKAMRNAVDAFFANIKGLRHEILETWRHAGTVICEGRVTYTRIDGSEVTLPFANIWRMRNNLIKEYLIYIDIQPLFSGAS